jgi:hypothetical protein
MQCCYTTEAVTYDHAGFGHSSIGSVYDFPHSITLMIVINTVPMTSDLCSEVVETGTAAPSTMYGYDVHLLFTNVMQVIDSFISQ